MTAFPRNPMRRPATWPFAALAPALILLLSLTVRNAHAQSSCTLTPNPGSVSLTAIGTASAGGFVPEIPQSITITATGDCGTLTAAAQIDSNAAPQCGSAGSFAGVPWLTATFNAGAVTYTVLTNTGSSTRTGSIAVRSSTGASVLVPVSEAADTEPIVLREVRLLYQSMLGRDPDAAGFAFWTGSGAAGLGQMADPFLTSPEAFNTGFAVMATYQAATGAPPSYAQFPPALGGIRSGSQSIVGLFDSLIAGNNGFNAATLYQNLFNRAPAVGEAVACSPLSSCFQNLIGYPANTTPAAAMNNEFQSTGSYANHASAAGDYTNSLYITMLYFVITGRDPDAGGLAFWTGIANRGGAGLEFQGSAGIGTRLQILGPGTPGQGFLGGTEFNGLFCP